MVFNLQPSKDTVEIPRSLATGSGFTPAGQTAQRLLIYLYGQNQPLLSLNREELAKALDVTPRTISRALEIARETGWIKVEGELLTVKEPQ